MRVTSLPTTRPSKFCPRSDGRGRDAPCGSPMSHTPAFPATPHSSTPLASLSSHHSSLALLSSILSPFLLSTSPFLCLPSTSPYSSFPLTLTHPAPLCPFFPINPYSSLSPVSHGHSFFILSHCPSIPSSSSFSSRHFLHPSSYSFFIILSLSY